MTVRRGVANCSFTSASSLRMMSSSLRPRVEDLDVAADLGHDLVELLGDLVALEAGQALQAQLEDGLRLLVGEAVAPRCRRTRGPRRAR